MGILLQPRSHSFKLIALSVFLIVSYTLYSTPPSLSFSWPYSQRYRSTCTPKAYAAGHWSQFTPNPNDNRTMSDQRDALTFAGFEGCASDREFNWHLGSDTPEQWNRWPGVASWEWEPESGCAIRPLDGTDMVRDLVMGGGWLLLGDSITEGHFFSLSCTLFPHVIATPNYTLNPYFDRSWPQHLFLNPASPLVAELQRKGFPDGFSIEHTPLVTFRRVDLLMSQEELNDMYVKEFMGNVSNESDEDVLDVGIGEDGEEENPYAPLFSTEAAWSLSPTEYLPIFLPPLSHTSRPSHHRRSPPSQSQGPSPQPSHPYLHYTTLILSTGGHWTTTLLSAFRDESLGDEAGYGVAGVLRFFERAMQVWADEVQTQVGEYNRANKHKPPTHRPKTVLVRAYLPGHEDCHAHREPWVEIEEYRWRWYNWPWIGEYNRIFENLLSSSTYSDIHFLPIDRPARLRPDTHATGDCLHVIAGPGVLEGWTHYMWHYITREVGAWVR